MIKLIKENIVAELKYPFCFSKDWLVGNTNIALAIEKVIKLTNTYFDRMNK